jgi:peptide/nickel transport system substrate-binding protein
VDVQRTLYLGRPWTRPGVEAMCRANNRLERTGFAGSTGPFGGWLNFPEYLSFWNHHSQNAAFNTMPDQNPAMDRLIDAARFDSDAKKYADDVPRVPMYRPNLDVAMQKNIRRYQYWFHRQLDHRQLAKE